VAAPQRRSGNGWRCAATGWARPVLKNSRRPGRVSRPAYGLTATFDTASRRSADKLSAVFEFEGMNREGCKVQPPETGFLEVQF
jgi:hypothetical protein